MEGQTVHNVSDLRPNGAIFLVKGRRTSVNANHKDERCSLLLFCHWNKSYPKHSFKKVCIVTEILIPQYKSLRSTIGLSYSNIATYYHACCYIASSFHLIPHNFYTFVVALDFFTLRLINLNLTVSHIILHTSSSFLLLSLNSLEFLSCHIK